jgi:4-amino-4-deoxy-L-arabinose transferase-like glycosyltransferase
VATAVLSPFGRDLFVGDETKYGQVVREMRASGSWFLPTLDGTPFTHKPPLHFWLIDALTFPLGTRSTWAFVLPSIAALLFLLWLIVKMSGSRLAAFVAGASLMIWGSAQTARMDVSFTAFITLAAWMLFVFFEREAPRALLVAAAALGIATLIKGPMAPVIGILLFIFEWIRRRRAPRGPYVRAIGLLAILPLLWAVPAMILGGSAYTREIVMKQTVGRAVASWVHKAPPWYYLQHLPGILFPWFFLALLAVLAARRGTPFQRFCLSWILAVLLPYSLMSSKLDVYMMALIPPVALLIGGLEDSRWLRAANVAMLLFYVLLGGVGLFLSPAMIKSPEAALIARGDVRGFFAVFAVLGIVGLLLVFLRRPPLAGIVAVGLVPLAAMAYAALFLMPLANELASTRPLITALEKQHVPPEQMALHACPYLWSRDLPPELERVRYVNARDLQTQRPVLIATSRIHAVEIAPVLAGYRKVDELRMIGKWFDVYRR